LARADAEPRRPAGRDEAGELRVGTPPPIRHEHSPGCSPRVPLLHLGEVVGEEGRDHQLQEHPGARMEEPQEVSHGNAAPRPLLCRLAERVLEGRRIGHRTSRAIDEKGAMAMPPPFVQGRPLHRAAETLEEEVKKPQREFGTRLTVGRHTEP
jgi:hypothetical protein